MAKLQKNIVPESAELMLTDAGYVRAEGIDLKSVYFFRDPMCVLFELDKVSFKKVVPGELGAAGYTTVLEMHNPSLINDNKWIMLFEITGTIPFREFEAAEKITTIPMRVSSGSFEAIVNHPFKLTPKSASL